MTTLFLSLKLQPRSDTEISRGNLSPSHQRTPQRTVQRTPLLTQRQIRRKIQTPLRILPRLTAPPTLPPTEHRQMVLKLTEQQLTGLLLMALVQTVLT
jgi:hypothetical protein